MKISFVLLFIYNAYIRSTALPKRYYLCIIDSRAGVCPVDEWMPEIETGSCIEDEDCPQRMLCCGPQVNIHYHVHTDQAVI